jgi:head-tail adaptor
MNQKIAILKNTSKDNLEEDWHECYEVFARLHNFYDHQIKNIEGVSFGHIMPANYLIFNIRFIEDLKVDMRIKCSNKYYSIQKIININQANKFINLIALELEGA